MKKQKVKKKRLKRIKVKLSFKGNKTLTHSGIVVMQGSTGEIFALNPRFGKPINGSDYKFAPGFTNNNLMALGVSEEMRTTVGISVSELFKLARYAKKRAAYFAKLDKKAKRRPGVFFLHAGNLTLCIGKRK